MHNTAGLLFALLTSWGYTWLRVCYTYFQQAFLSWKAADGTSRGAAKSAWLFFLWFFDQLGQDIVCMFKNCEDERQPFSNPSEGGHILRVCIGLSGFSSGLLGLASAGADRSGYSLWLQLTILVLIGLSLIAALGHLYVGWHKRLPYWRMYIMLTILWLIVGPVLYRMVIGW